jgi:hypothetical protein
MMGGWLHMMSFNDGWLHMMSFNDGWVATHDVVQ